MSVVEFPAPRQQRLQAKYICSACGADRGCNCNAPAVEKLAQKQEQDRQRAKEYRARKAEENQQQRHVTERGPPAEETQKPIETDVGCGQPADNPVITAWVGATSEQRTEFAKYVAEQKSQSQLGKALAAISDPTKTLTAALVTKAIDLLPHDLFMQGFIDAQRLRAALAEADAAEKLSTSTYSQTKLIKNGPANAVVS